MEKTGPGVRRQLALAAAALAMSTFAALPLLLKLAVVALAAGGWCFWLEHRGT